MRRKLNLKLIGSLLGGLLIAAVCVHFLHGYQLKRNAYHLLEHGDQAMGEKDFDKALAFYAQYLEFVPNDVDTVQRYAAVLDLRAANVGDRVRLILLMEQVLRVKPNEHEFRFRLVHNLIALGRVAEAMDQLRKLQGAWPDKAEVLHMFGWCHDAKKEYPQAVQSFEEAIRINPKQLKSYRLLAEVLRDRLNQPDEAQKIMDEMVKANADLCDAYLARGQFYRRRGDEKLAEADLEQAHRLGPDRPDVILEVADALRARGNWQRAGKLLEDGLKRHPDQTAFYLTLAKDDARRGQHADAIKRLEAGLRHAPKSNELAVLLIDLLIDQERFAEAREKTEALLKQGSRPALPSYLQARLHVADKKWSEAIELLETAEQDLGPASEWSGRVHALLGVCYRELGDHEQELQAFRRAVADEPAWVVANVGLGAALLSNGRTEDAVQTLEPLQKARDLPPGYWVLLSRARLYRQLRVPKTARQWGAVEAALGQAAKADPNGVSVSMVRAEYLAARGDVAAAEAILQKAKKEHPGDIAVWCALADLHARQNRFDAAEKTLETAGVQKTFADRIEWRLALCRLWGQRGTPDDRAKLLRLAARAPAALEDRARLLRELADVWSRLGDEDRAEKLLRDVARALPKDLGSRSKLFENALKKNQPAAARVWLGEMRAIEGEAGGLWRCAEVELLIHEARGRRDRLEEARKKLQEIEATHKNWPRVHLLNAAIAELEGNHQQAIREYTRALDLGEAQPRVLASLLHLLLERREFGKAETEIAKYEQKSPLTKDLARLGAEVALGMRDARYARIALQRAQQAVTLPTNDYREALWLARIYQAAGENAGAEALLRKNLDSAGHAPDAWVAWMEFLAQSNRRPEGLTDLERMKKTISVPRQPLTLARCYEALGMPDRADRAYQDALREAPEDFTLLSYAADFYRRADRSEEARRLYERLLDPALAAPAEISVTARRHLAVLLGLAGANARAIALLDAVVETRGDTLTDQRLRLFLQSLTPSALPDALNQFQESLRQQLPTPDERLLLAHMFESADHLGQAHTQLSLLANEYPTTPRYLARYARLLIRMEEWQEADRVITRLEALEPGSERGRELRAALKKAKKS